MEEWRFEPAHDFGLSAEQRRLSLRREVGLESAISCFLWRSITRLYLAIAHRLKIRGRDNLPTHPPFVLVANHASHLDAIILGGILPLRFVGAVFPIAAGDTFFTKRASSIFATAFYERIADLAKKLRRAFAGRFARTVTERQLCLHFISGRNTHSHRRDGNFQTRAGTAGGGNERPDRALLFEWNVCRFTGIGHRATLEKNLRHDWKTVVVFGNDQ
jgi:1-acyl-sn-glycerol-3-phosphate acyltransferase